MAFFSSDEFKNLLFHFFICMYQLWCRLLKVFSGRFRRRKRLFVLCRRRRWAACLLCLLGWMDGRTDGWMDLNAKRGFARPIQCNATRWRSRCRRFVRYLLLQKKVFCPKQAQGYELATEWYTNEFELTTLRIAAAHFRMDEWMLWDRDRQRNIL